MSLIFVVLLAIGAILTITLVMGLLVLGGVVALRTMGAAYEAKPPPEDPRSLAPTQVLTGRTSPTTQLLESEEPRLPARQADPTAAVPVRAAVSSHQGELPNEVRSTEMFAANVGDLSDLGIDDVDERR